MVGGVQLDQTPSKTNQTGRRHTYAMAILGSARSATVA